MSGWLQNQGNSNVLSSFIPTPEMMAGNFTTDNPDNLALCPNGFYGTPPTTFPQRRMVQRSLRNNFSGRHAVFRVNTTPTVPNAGNKIPSKFIDPGAAALAKIWPKANANPATSVGHVNYYQPIPNLNNGWIYRVRLDYQLGRKHEDLRFVSAGMELSNWRKVMARTCTGRRAIPSLIQAAASLRHSAASRWRGTSSITSAPQPRTT